MINGQMKQAAAQFIAWWFTFKEYDEYNIASMPGEIARLADAVVLHLRKEFLIHQPQTIWMVSNN